MVRHFSKIYTRLQVTKAWPSPTQCVVICIQQKFTGKQAILHKIHAIYTKYKVSHKVHGFLLRNYFEKQTEMGRSSCSFIGVKISQVITVFTVVSQCVKMPLFVEDKKRVSIHYILSAIGVLSTSASCLFLLTCSFSSISKHPFPPRYCFFYFSFHVSQFIPSFIS